MIPFEEVSVLDGNAEALGVPTSQLMQNAGKAIADHINQSYHVTNVLFLCGPGNNGGDGMVAANYLNPRTNARVLFPMEPEEIRTTLARKAYQNIEPGIDIKRMDSLDRCLEWADLVVDALLGAGIRGELREPYASLVKRVNAFGKPVISVDAPTGLGTAVTIRPGATVTFHDIKEGMNERNSGRIVVRDIGIPREADLYVGPGERVLYPIPGPDSHKGMNGKVLVVGGGPFTGAPALAGIGALRAGADLVYIAAPDPAAQAIATFSPDLIVRSAGKNHFMNKDTRLFTDLINKADAVLIGPGLGNRAGTNTFIEEVLDECKQRLKRVVIDADALEVMSITPRTGLRGILTPHMGEMRKLVDQVMEREVAASLVSERFGMTVLLKGKEDIIVDATTGTIRKKRNRTGNPGMTVGGTGDILAGISAALLARGMSPYNSARLAAYLNGRAGDIAFEKKGYGMTASDMLDEIPRALKGL